METFRTVYIFTQENYTGMYLLGVIFSVLFLSTLRKLFYLHRTGNRSKVVAEKGAKHWGANPLVDLLVLGGACFFCFGFFVINLHEYQQYRALLDDYQHNRTKVIEGPVHVIHEEAKDGHSYFETITIAGTSFTFSYFNFNPGYQVPISHDGVLREGVYVRITHKDGYILRIEMK